MTRVNLVPPSELKDQHLFTEFREIKMVPRALERSLRNHSTQEVLKTIPSTFTLGKGHVLFFYDKGAYLRRRYQLIRMELRRRGINFNEDSEFDPNGVYYRVTEFDGNYVPTQAAMRTIRARIAEKIAMKPNWYRHSPYVLPMEFHEWKHTPPRRGLQAPWLAYSHERQLREYQNYVQAFEAAQRNRNA